ncbi:MAG: 50S ribosomal protein L24 [Gammaproteobacteria bacterium]
MSTLHTKTKLKTGDEVVVIAGRDVGKRGTIQKILKNNRALVTGVNIVKKHTKPNPQAGITGGIVEQESSIDLSNIAIWNPNKKKSDRVGFSLNGKEKIRIFKSDKVKI